MVDIYRAYGAMDWQNAIGNAILALYNKKGSGKKINILSFEITTQCIAKAVAAVSVFDVMLGNIDPSAYDKVSVFKFDSAAPDLPSQIRVVRDAVPSSNSGTLFRRIVYKQLGTSTLSSQSWEPFTLQTKQKSGVSSMGSSTL